MNIKYFQTKKLYRNIVNIILSVVLIITTSVPVYAATPSVFSCKTIGVNLGDSINVCTMEADYYKLSSQNIISISDDGTITGINRGKVVVTAGYTMANGKKKTSKLTVYVEEPKLSKNHIYINQGKTYKLKTCDTKTKVTDWESSDTYVATVKAGKVIASNPGKCQITCKINRVTYTCDVTVENPVLKESNVVLGKGDTRLVELLNTEQTPTWHSKKSSICKVDVFGKITAVSKGSTYIYCNINSTNYKVKVTVSKDVNIHKCMYGSSEIKVQPTCEEDGVSFRKCRICGNVIETVIPATGHTYSEKNITKYPTCEENGSKEYICSTCGKLIKEEIPATGHKEGEWEIRKEATCSEAGIMQKRCKLCGRVLEEKEIPVTGHELTEYDYELIPGYGVKQCNKCGKIIEKEPIPYTVKFDSNGGNLNVKDLHIKYGESKEIPSCVSNLDGKLTTPLNGNQTFLGWNTDKNANYALYKDNAIIKNLTTIKDEVVKLFAIWTSKKGSSFTVIYKTEGLDGKYGIYNTATLYGLAETEVTPIPIYISGYTHPESQTKKINADGSTEFIYKYSRKKYNITAHYDNGITTVSGNKTYYYDDIASIEATLKEGYMFEKWTGDYPSSKILNTFTMPAKNIEISANTVPISYSINYELDGGITQFDMIQNYTVETENITLEKPTRQGYVFLGWTGSNGNIPEKSVIISKGSIGNKEYKANWLKSELADYTVTVYHKLMNLDGKTYTVKETEKITATYNSKVTPATKMYDGFTSPSVQTITVSNTEDNTVIYDYIRNKYTVSLVKGTGIENVTGNKSYYYGDEVTVKAEPEEGYMFKGWSGSFNSNTSTYVFDMSDVNISLTASGKPISYAILYDYDGAEEISNPSKYTIEDANITLKNPTKKGYVFLGWTGSNGTTPEKNVVIEKGTVGSKTYKANWKPIIYTVEFDVNGGNGTMEPVSVSYNETKSLPENTFERSGYQFMGWGITKDKVVYTDKEKIKNLKSENQSKIILYAIWKEGFHVGSKITDANTGYTFVCADLNYNDTGKALMIMEDVIPCNGKMESTKYSECPIFSENCASYNSSILKNWIETVFYNSLDESLKEKIVETADFENVFLLSSYETEVYKDIALKQWKQSTGKWGYWTRSSYWNNTDGMLNVYYIGTSNIDITDIGAKVAFVIDIKNIG